MLEYYRCLQAHKAVSDNSFHNHIKVILKKKEITVLSMQDYSTAASAAAFKAQAYWHLLVFSATPISSIY